MKIVIEMDVNKYTLFEAFNVGIELIKFCEKHKLKFDIEKK